MNGDASGKVAEFKDSMFSLVQKSGQTGATISNKVVVGVTNAPDWEGHGSFFFYGYEEDAWFEVPYNQKKVTNRWQRIDGKPVNKTPRLNKPLDAVYANRGDTNDGCKSRFVDSKI